MMYQKKSFLIFSNKNMFLDVRRRKSEKPDLTIFKNNVPEHSIDLDAACPKCLAIEASKPGAHDGELNRTAIEICTAFTDIFVSR